MSFYKFETNDIFYNRIKTYPEVSVVIYASQSFYQNEGYVAGAHTATSSHVPPGYINLYEINVDRSVHRNIGSYYSNANDERGLVFPFITKNGSLTSFRTATTSKFNTDFVQGDIIKGKYPLSASITSDYFAKSATRETITALKNRLNYYQIWSYDFAYSSDLGDKSDQELRLISIPSIFYGSSIKKGSVSLKFYVSGTEIAELKDDKYNGQLRQVATSSGPSSLGAASGSVGGVVMYNEGFIVLTGSWELSTHTEDYIGTGASVTRWIDFGAMSDSIPSSSFALTFSGTNYVPTLMMMAHAPKGELNHSNNPTYPKQGTVGVTGTLAEYGYEEPTTLSIANVGSSSFSGSSRAFQKTTFINHVGIYDEHKNLIAVTKLANPVRKRENDDYTFKLKLDF